MFAIVQLGGKQYKVKEKDILRIEKLETPVGESVKSETVLLLADGQKTAIGTPYLKNASAELKVLETGLSDKVRIFKMKSKKRYKRLRGHRQPYSEVEVVKLSA